MSNRELYKLAEAVVEGARSKGLTVATAESCTGGWIGKCLTDIPGSSSVFPSGLIAYSNDVKQNLLGVPVDILKAHGAVSTQTANAMAKNCAQCFGADIAVSVTGIAGPGGGSKEKPVGLVYMGICKDGETQTHEFRFDDTGRDGVRQQALQSALTLLLKAVNQT